MARIAAIFKNLPKRIVNLLVGHSNHGSIDMAGAVYVVNDRLTEENIFCLFFKKPVDRRDRVSFAHLIFQSVGISKS